MDTNPYCSTFVLSLGTLRLQTSCCIDESENDKVSFSHLLRRMGVFYVVVYCYERSYSDLLPIFLLGCLLVFLLVYGNFKNMTDTNLLWSGRTESI